MNPAVPAPPAPGGPLPDRLPPLPPCFELPMQGTWGTVDFLSDLHLDADHPATLATLASHLRHTPADAVLILGDLFEAWVGDDARHEGCEHHVAELLQQASARIAVGFMPGNRDFLVGSAFLRDCGLLALADPTLLSVCGRRLLLSHGDALCLADTDYLRFRAEVRSEAWRQRFLAQPLAQRRALAAQMRAASRARQAAGQPETWADVDHPAALHWLQQAGAADLVHGHTHRPGDHGLAPGHQRRVLSDWDCDGPGPARAEVLRLDAQGFRRLPPDHA